MVRVQGTLAQGALSGAASATGPLCVRNGITVVQTRRRIARVDAGVGLWAWRVVGVVRRTKVVQGMVDGRHESAGAGVVGVVGRVRWRAGAAAVTSLMLILLLLL